MGKAGASREFRAQDESVLFLPMQEALKNHDSWMEDVSNTLQQMQEKEENLTEDRRLTSVLNLCSESDICFWQSIQGCCCKSAGQMLLSQMHFVPKEFA